MSIVRYSFSICQYIYSFLSTMCSLHQTNLRTGDQDIILMLKMEWALICHSHYVTLTSPILHGAVYYIYMIVTWRHTTPIELRPVQLICMMNSYPLLLFMAISVVMWGGGVWGWLNGGLTLSYFDLIRRHVMNNLPIVLCGMYIRPLMMVYLNYHWVYFTTFHRFMCV